MWADHETEPDLFWAVRGGGGSFGVVTAIEIELFECPELYAGAMFWPAERAGEVLRAWRAWVDTVPNEVTSVARVLHFPPLPHVPEPLRGGSFAIVEAVFSGPELEGQALVAPLRALAPCMDTFATVESCALEDLHMDPREPIPAAGDGIFVEGLPLEAIDAVVETAVPPLLTLEIRHLGGVLAEPSPRHGAVGAIDAGFVMFAAGPAPTPEAHAAVADAIDRAKAALRPWESARTYFNFSERPIDPSRLYPAETYERLCHIKAIYDPSGLLVSNHPIPSAHTRPTTRHQGATMKTTTKTRATFIPRDEQEQLLLLGSTMTIMATNTDTGGLMEWVLIESGPEGDVSPHRHPWAEAYYVLDGSMEVQVGARHHIAAPGDFLMIPPRAVHCFHVLSDSVRFLHVSVGEGATDMFRDLAAVSADGLDLADPAALEAIGELATRYGIELVGPEQA